MSRCRAARCRNKSVVVMQVARKSRALCKEHAQEVLDGNKIELKPYRMPGVEPTPRLFIIDRSKDNSGISGVGVVAEGVQYTDGTVVIRWITETATTALFDSIEDVQKVHGYRGDSVIKFLDEI